MKNLLIILVFLLSFNIVNGQRYGCYNVKSRPPISKSVKYHQKLQKKLLFTKFRIKPPKIKYNRVSPPRRKYSFRVR